MSVMQTDERLRTWLDSNQLARERVALAIIKTDKRFKNVQPRHPRGGPDGGRDIQASYESQEVFIAVGFLNSANDSDKDRRKTIRKFKSDLKRAKEENKDLQNFIFITNVNLTTTQKRKSMEHARGKGIYLCDIYDRERLRIVLDSPDGFAIRYQYLGISLSEAEQAAFFTKWGDTLQDFISQSFESVSDKLSRIQFLQEANKPLRSINFVCRLKDKANIGDSPHYRAVMIISSPTPMAKFKQLHIGTCDVGFSAGIRRATFTNDGVIRAFWEDDPKKIVTSGGGEWVRPIRNIVGAGGYWEFAYREHMVNLWDLNECFFGFFTNESLANKINSIEVYANEYLLWHSDMQDLHVDSHSFIPETPWEFAPSELVDKWVRIMPKSGVGILRFDEITPKRFFEPKVVSDKCLTLST
jgi:hypothetical protein